MDCIMRRASCASALPGCSLPFRAKRAGGAPNSGGYAYINTDRLSIAPEGNHTDGVAQ